VDKYTHGGGEVGRKKWICARMKRRVGYQMDKFTHVGGQVGTKWLYARVKEEVDIYWIITHIERRGGDEVAICADEEER